MLSGFIVGLNSFCAVAGIFILRRRNPGHNFYKNVGLSVNSSDLFVSDGVVAFLRNNSSPRGSTFWICASFAGIPCLFFIK